MPTIHDGFDDLARGPGLPPRGHESDQRGVSERYPAGNPEPAAYAATYLAALLEFAVGDVAEGVAKALIGEFGSLSAVLAAGPMQLAAVPGTCHHVVHRLQLVHGILGHVAQEQIAQRELIGSSTVLEKYLLTRLRATPVEQLRCLFLDRKNRLIKDELVREGVVDHVPLYPREIVGKALHYHASAVILAHNHPSGDPTPSRSDIEMTRRVADALTPLDIALHDHVIVGHNQVKSLRTLGLL